MMGVGGGYLLDKILKRGVSKIESLWKTGGLGKLCPIWEIWVLPSSPSASNQKPNQNKVKINLKCMKHTFSE